MSQNWKPAFFNAFFGGFLVFSAERCTIKGGVALPKALKILALPRMAAPPPLPNPGTLVDLRAICTTTPPKVYSALLNLGELNLTLV